MDSVKPNDVSIEIPGGDNNESVKSKGVKFFLESEDDNKKPSDVSVPNGPKRISFPDDEPKDKAIQRDSGISTSDSVSDDLSTNDKAKLVSAFGGRKQNGDKPDTKTPLENGTVKKGILKHSNTTPDLSTTVKPTVTASKSFKDIIKDFGATQEYENPGFEFGEKVPEVPKLSDVVKSLLEDTTPQEVHPYGSGTIDKEKRSILATHGPNIIIWVMFSGVLIFGLAGGIIFAAATWVPKVQIETTVSTPPMQTAPALATPMRTHNSTGIS